MKDDYATRMTDRYPYRHHGRAALKDWRTPMTAPELKPCPFCGATPHRGLSKIKHDQLHGEAYQDTIIKCPHLCGVMEGGFDAVVERWNTRADLADAHVAAAYEAAANAAKGEGESEFFNPIQAIRALTLDDAKAALETVLREARRDALREAQRVCVKIPSTIPPSITAAYERGAADMKDAILALLDNPQEDKT